MFLPSWLAREACRFAPAVVVLFALSRASFFSGLAARAQEREEQSAPPPAESASPPRALTLGTVAWPTGLPLPDSGVVELGVLVGRDGWSQLDDCALEARACDAVAAALLESEFLPAELAGQPIAARVGVRFPVQLVAPRSTEHALVPHPTVSDTKAPAAPTLPPALPPAPSDADEAYGAEAVITHSEPTAQSVSLEQIREVPGAFGDPFRVIEALPGVVPVMSGVPYVYVRGAPPSATAYFYDGIQMPMLFHLGLGPAVVHPAMVGGIDFYPGVAPARYGRKTGGTVVGNAALRPLKPGLHGELELRLVDLQAYAAKPFGKRGRIEFGGRYGYPGLLIKAFESSAVVQYWDYQLRTVVPLANHTEASVIALGSFDFIGTRHEHGVERQLEIQFHRVEARLVKRDGDFEMGSALTGGIERSGLADEFDVHAYRIGSKVWLDSPLPADMHLRVGADMLATSGRIQNPLAGERDETVSGAVASQNPLYRSATGRNVIGAYAEWRVPFARRFEVDAGLRGDVWLTGSEAQHALEPRATLRWFAREGLALHAAAGLAYQPAVFLIPLPGISDVALDRGLQRAVQAEIGGQLQLPASFYVETKLFAHQYRNMLSIDALDVGDVDCTTVSENGEARPEAQVRNSCDEEDDGLSRLSARAYGSEWLIRRDYSENLSGWLSYTLSKADGHNQDGTRLIPNFDVRHVANLVLQWRITSRWHVSVRGFAQSGRFPLGAGGALDPRQRARLPAFYRGDLNVSRIWQRRWGELRVGLDWLNFTFRREPLSWSCNWNLPQGAPCKVEYVAFPVTLPVLGVRGSY